MNNEWRNSKRYMQNLNALYGDGKPAAARKSPSASNTPMEHTETAAFVKWLKAHDILFFGVPNGAKRTPYERMMCHAEGVMAGVPDLFICEPNGNFAGLFIEMKRTQGGVVSEAQADWHEKLKNRGYAVFVAYGCADAIMITKTYLEMLNAA